MGVRDLTPQGRVDRLVVRGSRLTDDVQDRVLTGGSVELSVDEPTKLAFTVADPQLTALESRLFAPGAAIDFAGLKFTVSALEPAADGDAVTVLNVTARSVGVRRLRRQKGPKVWRNTSPDQVARAAGGEAGLRVVAQPTARRKQIARGRRQSSWALLGDLAEQCGFVCFEAHGTLFFAQPTWLAKRKDAAVHTLTWDRRNGRPTGVLVAFPTCRRSEDSKRNAAELDFQIVGAGVEEWRTGDVVHLKGVPTYEGHYLVTTVTIPLSDEEPVQVHAETPVNPEKQKRTPIRSTSTVRGTITTPSGSGGGASSSATVERFVQTALAQAGDRYVYGAEASKNDPDPDAFDCSELVEWALARVGVFIPDGSSAQREFCRSHGTLIPISQAIGTRGALLFANGHVAISLGNGRTIEAMNRTYGVRQGNANGRPWIAGGLVPGLPYPKRGRAR